MNPRGSSFSACVMRGPLPGHAHVQIVAWPVAIMSTTSEPGCSRLAQGNTSQIVMAEAEKFSGEPPEVTIFVAPTAAG